MRSVIELGLDGLGVDLLHAAGRLVRRQLGDLVEQRVGVLVPGPQTFEVEDADPAEPADFDGGRRARRRRPWPTPSAAGRSGRRRSPTRCRRLRGRACAGSGRWRCRRTRTLVDPTCRCRSRPQPLADLRALQSVPDVVKESSLLARRWRRVEPVLPGFEGFQELARHRRVHLVHRPTCPRHEPPSRRCRP